jgi:hypothetical protein
MILHVPERLRGGRVSDENQIAFLTDLVPTLYDLLGAGYTPSTPLVGRPLLAASAADLTARSRDVYLVQSSYSRAFGLLDGRGAWMYVANANQAREDFFDLRSDARTPTALSAPDRVQYRKWLFDRLGELNAYYAAH